MLSLDTETTGLDLRHGAAPYFVTAAESRGPGVPPTQRFWEWPVDPYTREVLVPDDDLDEIEAAVAAADRVVMQNGKFDVAALSAHRPAFGTRWPWGRTEDTLLAGHLLASNRPKDLTALAGDYLGLDIQPLEDALHGACEEARRYCRFRLKTWAIAAGGREDMPSAGDKDWKTDGWLPRQLLEDQGPDKLAEYFGKDVTHWAAVLRDYANADGAVTLLLWPTMERAIRDRGLWAIYEERRKVLRIAHDMESGGVTYSLARVDELDLEFSARAARHGAACLGVAAKYDYPLELPAGGVNASLRTFCADVLQLPPVYSPKAKTAAPSLDKEAFAHYLQTLPPDSDQFRFVNDFLERRRRLTALGFLNSYRRFGVPAGHEDVLRLHPNLNPTGTDTLRWSCKNPNEQNISKQETECRGCRGEGCPECGGTGKEFRSVRYCFGPAPGEEWWSLDAKNIELRLPAYESGEREMIALFERPDDPPFYGSNHLLNFSVVYPDIWGRELRAVGLEKVGPHCKKKYASTNYQWCKNGGFAKQYGAQKRKTDATFHVTGAYELIAEKFARLEALNRHWVRYAEKHGYVETIPDKTVDPARGYPLLCTRTNEGGVLPTVPLNYHVQGSAMWWTMKAMIRTDARLRRWRAAGFPCRIVMQVHDELVFAMRKAPPAAGGAPGNLWRARLLQKDMERGGDDFGIPTPVGVEYNEHTWASGVSY